MRYVILRDDDANALTPPHMLERLYRPFLDRGFPVHLAVIPEVRADVRRTDGVIEGFLTGDARGQPRSIPIAENAALLDYVRAEPCYRIVQHGLRHELIGDRFEFDREDRRDIVDRLTRGRERLREAGLGDPITFVAPQDRMTRVSFLAVAERYQIVSTGWFSLANTPRRYWANYLFTKKLLRKNHFRFGGCTFFSHPGCILSYQRDPQTILPALKREILSRAVTVVVSHHWEYFAGGTENGPLLEALAELLSWLVARRDIRVVTFDEAKAYV